RVGRGRRRPLFRARECPRRMQCTESAREAARTSWAKRGSARSERGQRTAERADRFLHVPAVDVADACACLASERPPGRGGGRFPYFRRRLRATRLARGLEFGG